MGEDRTSRARRNCPVCHADGCEPFAELAGQQYWRCRRCVATFLDPRHYLTRAEEHAHYRRHRNAIDDPGYRAFLNRLAAPLLERLADGACGLDYGAGPGPALADMLRTKGHPMAIYDPLFAPDPTPLGKTYDFVTATETAEHFHSPSDEFETFARLLKPGGWLGLMTSFLVDDDNFASWYYRRDPTHVVFYKRDTLAYIAHQFGWEFESPAANVALLRKPSVPDHYQRVP